MRKPLVSPRLPLSASLVVALAAVPHAGPGLQAQVLNQHLRNTTHVGLGYVANVPNTFVGASVLALTPRLFGGAGVYADVKLSVTSPANRADFAPGVTVQQAELTFGDTEYTTRSVYRSVNFGLVYAILPEFLLYGGAGYTSEDHFRNYYDDQEIRGDLGWYWVEDTANSGGRLNLLGGAFFRLNKHVLFQAGGETKPGGVTLGFTVVFPT